MTVDDKSFSVFLKTNPEKAKEHLVSVRDVTGITDDDKIRRALDKARESTGEFNLNKAIEILLAWNQRSVTPEEMVPSPSPAVIMSPPVNQPQQQQQQPPQQQQAKRPVVDLTDESKNENDIQRAIALSLADGSVGSGGVSSTATSRPAGVSQEDQDVSKALEASLLESASSRRKEDNHNPRDKQRDGEWPVGLKNVGQTCWFSAVIQSLFHLPAFRYLVLNFNSPQKEAKSDRERIILEFMLELRKLFSLLLGTQKKYVDPSRAVGILRGTMGGESQFSNNQQDVSEFTHKLLDWLEEAFKISDKFAEESPHVKQCDTSQAMDSDTEKCDKEKDSVVLAPDKLELATSKKNNPMYNLFYGRVKIEGKNQGNVFSREEPFGQWPLQVNNFSDIHDSLEASTAHEFIDTSSQTDLAGVAGQSAVRKSGQERWFTQLPPVLFFELSRFQFNQTKGVAEKVNNYLDFPDVIYMDRYLDVNKNITRSKREVVRHLKEKQDSLKSQLEKFMKYGDDANNTCPVANILKYSLDFARAGAVAADGGGVNGVAIGEESSARESDIASPGGGTAMQVDSPCPSPATLTPASSFVNLSNAGKSTPEKQPLLKTLPDGSVVIPIKVEASATSEGNQPTPMEVEASANQDSPVAKLPAEARGVTDPMPAVGGGDTPAPRHISDLELKVLSSCLSRWRAEVEEDIAGLNRSLQEIESSISKMYDDYSLKQTAYKLHAVMVHEGDVNQGHYWAYVYHTTRQVWLKFNDNSVSETTWEVLKKESAGGRMNTSAYSMVYIDASRPDLTHVSLTGPGGEPGSTRETLSPDLERYLMEDNKAFAAELLNWDTEKEKKQSEEVQEGVLIGDDPECQIIEHKSDFSNSHAALAKEATLRTIQHQQNSPNERKKPSRPISAVVNDLYTCATKKVREISDKGDAKLDSFVHYLIANEVGQDLLRRGLYEQVGLSCLESVSESVRSLVKEARDLLADSPPGVVEESQKWHKSYHNYRVVCFYFLLGVERFEEKKLEEAVELLTTSYIVNDRLRDPGEQGLADSKKMLPTRGLMKYFRSSVEALNCQYVEEFEKTDNPTEVAYGVSRVLVPGVHILQARTNLCSTGADAAVLEEVRGRWCAMLETPMPKIKHDYWTTVFNTVVSDDNTAKLRQPQNLRYPKLTEDLCLADRYRQTMQKLCNKIGDAPIVP